MRLEALVGGSSEVVGPETPLATAAAVMLQQEVSAVAVVDGRALVGILTDRDLTAAVAACADAAEEVVSAWMSEAPDVVDPEVRVSEAAQWMLETGYRHLPVMAGGELLGIVDVRDLLWALANGGS